MTDHNDPAVVAAKEAICSQGEGTFMAVLMASFGTDPEAGKILVNVIRKAYAPMQAKVKKLDELIDKIDNIILPHGPFGYDPVTTAIARVRKLIHDHNKTTKQLDEAKAEIERLKELLAQVNALADDEIIACNQACGDVECVTNWREARNFAKERSQ